jgi:hypothetical protein
MAFLEASCAPAKNGGDGVGLTRKGAKCMFVDGGNGLPLGFHLPAASCAEVHLAGVTLDTIAASRGRPEKVVADREYARKAFRATPRRRGISMCIPAKRRPARWKAKPASQVLARRDDSRLRYTVERTFA